MDKGGLKTQDKKQPKLFVLFLNTQMQQFGLS